MQILTQLSRGLAALQPLSSTPTSCSASQDAVSRAVAIVDITQTMSLFALLLDDHAYTDLGRVFTVNATADFNATGIPVCEGLPAIIERLEDLRDASSMMAISTQFVEVQSSVAARATSYVTGNMFTPGWTEPSFTEYGKYITDFVLTEAGWRVDSLVAVGWAVFDRWETQPEHARKAKSEL
ncbi:hypothetical protein N7471_008696 [Penicillium samsonianum]|uniref:uncharacterized protein n=1 Tax=Penicillium samsonianum TaxID=1882272 RepID=UPI002549A5D1|nr:uncharacterized protein N7471_008696 [Penicillium samsonianum]KAJ6133481.1 hypothetical protein N7471_008696 [Penicillium samsonianum]